MCSTSYINSRVADIPFSRDIITDRVVYFQHFARLDNFYHIIQDPLRGLTFVLNATNMLGASPHSELLFPYDAVRKPNVMAKLNTCVRCT